MTEFQYLFPSWHKSGLTWFSDWPPDLCLCHQSEDSYFHLPFHVIHIGWDCPVNLAKSRAMGPNKQLGFSHGCSLGPGVGDCDAGLGQSRPCPHVQAHHNWEGLPHGPVPISVTTGAGGLQESQGCLRRVALAEELELQPSPLPQDPGPEAAAGVGAPCGLGGGVRPDAEGPGCCGRLVLGGHPGPAAAHAAPHPLRASGLHPGSAHSRIPAPGRLHHWLCQLQEATQEESQGCLEASVTFNLFRLLIRDLRIVASGDLHI